MKIAEDPRGDPGAIMPRRHDAMKTIMYFKIWNALVEIIEIEQTVYRTVKEFAVSVGMVINTKKSVIQLHIATYLPESLRDIPRLD